MSLELVNALLVIAKLCASQSSCAECPMATYCAKQPLQWGE